jgi:hypothetical protein
MKLATIVVTRSKSCHVKTLHTILRINIKCLVKSFNNEIVYVTDDPFEKARTIEQYMKSHDRIIFVDFGVGLDEESISQCFDKHEHVGCLVFPGVKEGIDWGLFKAKVKDGSSEPVSQMGMHFDTEINKKISSNIYNVTSTRARAWMMNTKPVYKTLAKNNDTKISANYFEKFLRQNVRIYAFTAAKLTIIYTHECISNILNAAGVKTS